MSLRLKITFYAILFLWCSQLYGQQSSSTDIRFTILHTNDEHSHLIPIPAVDDHSELDNTAGGGIARLAGVIDLVRQEKAKTGEPVLLFSGGDNLGGPAFGWLPLRNGLAPEMSLFHMMGYDAITIGNHEFDYGSDVYARYLSDAGYPEAANQTVILGTNTRPPRDHPMNKLGIKNHVIKELDNGLRIGILGLIGYDAISKTAQPGPVQFDDPIESARKAITELLQEDVDLIISVNHSGVAEDRQLAETLPEIDIIVGGHTHTPLHEPVFVGETVIVQAGSYMQFLGRLELSYNPVEDRLSVINRETGQPFLMPINSTSPVNREIADEVERYTNILNEWLDELTTSSISDIRQTIAYSDFPVLRDEFQRESAIGNFVTDAMKYSAQRVLDQPVDIAVQANGAIRSNIMPGEAEWSRGEITFYDMMMAFGLGSGSDGTPGYPLVSFYLTEQEVRNALEVSILLSELMGDNYFLQFSGLHTIYNPDRAVLFTIPFIGTPIPSSRAVLRADLVNGDQTESIRRDSDNLLHVVTDYYIAGFLPMVGERLPNLTITLRDENGRAITLDEAVVYDGDRQLKVWSSVLDYVQTFEQNEDGLPVIPAQYKAPEGRQTVTYTLPLWVWPVAAVILIGFVIFLIVKRK
ncbi:bifunctional metallophosphatase/5'-nucleotidase [Rhodohalobacter halophilus]|uniref:bifunctional metallophosphatase/5'-nucleotidase n=1 Tax=Rhodohalobacter halophilus TaxID=1812810 RepID=UPI00083F5AC9|nr:bifunctional UDP-sugar hydrolase/5'-nucleotidase [Rhodohalobacter halophilus]